jgi:hypothetical protein
MPATLSALSFADVPAIADEEFLSTVADILERLRAQSERRGHPLLASLLAITKDEAVDDLRTRAGELDSGGLLNDADDGVIKMARRFSCGRRDGVESEDFKVSAQLLSFIRA